MGMLAVCKKHYDKIILFLTMLLTVILTIVLVNIKQGYYLDEYYTYTIANGEHVGISIIENEWNDTKPFFEELIVTDADRFDFAKACNNTANDVHPPLYYILVNFVSSFFVGKYSKWFAISINVIAALLCELLMYKIIMTLSKNRNVSTLLVVGAFINHTFISYLIYSRMYFLLSTIALAYVYLHLLMLIEKKVTPLKMAGVFALGLIGFLTHYYMLFVMFFCAAFFCLYFFFALKKRIMAIVYGGVICSVLVAEYIVWPVFIAHIFFGYRGKEAMESFTNVNGIFYRIRLFWGMLSVDTFSGFLLVLMILAVALLIWMIIRKKGAKQGDDSTNAFDAAYSDDSTNSEGSTDAVDSANAVNSVASVYYALFVCAICLGYFLAVALTALPVNRFLFPLEGIFCICLLYIIFEIVRMITKKEWVQYGIIVGIIAITTIVGYCKYGIEYLYLDRAAVNNAVAMDQNDKTIVFYDIMYDDIIDLLSEYDEAYLSGPEVDEDKVLSDIGSYIDNNDNVIVFVEKTRDYDAIEKMLLKNFDSVSSMELIGMTNEYYYVYYLK